jgi:penicillin-binding protein 1A
VSPGPRNGPRRRRDDGFTSNGRRRSKRRVRSRRRSRVAVLVGIFVLLGAVAAGLGFAGASDLREKCNLSELRPARIGANTFVYAADGSLLGSIPAERNREPVALGKISPWMRKATIAIEDRRFYEHGGIDLEGIARALVRDVEAGRVVEGGSTITQQLVRNLYIRKNERTLERKLVEACLAVRLNDSRSKDWILSQYMNTVYYGNHAYGIEAAAQTYFSRPARKLSLLQAALLAGLPQAPSFFDPFEYPGRAVARRNRVLRALYQNGDISYAHYREGITVNDLKLKRGRIYTRIHEPYFFSYVREELIKEYGAETVRSGGLRVYTTIDRRLQRAANRAIRDTLYNDDDPASAIVAIDPRSGAIRAMTAVTPGRTGNQFNLAAQARRQAGSTFKTFVLTTAVSEGVNPDSTTYSSRFFVYQPDSYSEPWEVSTYSREYLGTISVARATLASDNTVFAQLTLDLGPDKIAAMAHRLGIRSSLKTKEGVHVPTLGLGAMGVSPLEMASAYATLAAGGVYSEPMAIRKVELAQGGEDDDAGWGTPRRRRVIADWVADAVTEILEDNIQSGTGTAAAIGRPAAGKTGTTDDFTDAWFCGYTPNLSTTVWVGYPQANIPMRSVHGISVAGGTFPAQIWNRFMSPALDGTRVWEFPEPQSEPIWHPFTRGQYAGGSSGSYDYDSGGSYDYSPPPPSTSTSPSRPKPAPPPPPRKSRPPPPPPPVDPVPPPPPAEPPPPPPAPPSPPL